jgi:phosphatidylglycerol lysyltransferase
MKSWKIFFQFVLAIALLGLAVYFIQTQQFELERIVEHLAQADLNMIGLGLVFTAGLIGCHAALYFYSFRAIHKEVTYLELIDLFLKRNVISVLLPAGGFTSLSFFSKGLKKRGLSSEQIYLASYLYATIGLISVVIVGIPFIAIMYFVGHLDYTLLIGMIVLILFLAVLILLFFSVWKQKWMYNFLVKRSPKIEQIINRVVEERFKLKPLMWALIASVFIEIIGVIHMYISLEAIGVEPDIVACILAYIAMIILLLASPFLRGMGAIEVSMTFILMKYGYTASESAASTLLFRFFEFWVLLALGIIAIIIDRLRSLLT